MHLGGWRLLTLVAAGACLAAPASAQDETRYWPLKEVNFPVPLDRLPAGAQKPVKLRFHVRPEGGTWREAYARAPESLEVIDKVADRRGFRYVAPGDGVYDFCLQQEFGNGDRTPRDAALTAEYRVVFDTRPPELTARKVGPVTIEWEATDTNLLESSLQLEARWIGEAEFAPISPGVKLKARDRYSWDNLEADDDELEVRVVVRDRANHTSSSEVLRLSRTGGGGTTRPATPRAREASAGTPSGVGAAPGIVYSSSRDLKIISKVQQVTRSGIAKSHLFVRTPETNWAKVKEKAEQIAPDAKDATITWDHTVERDGRYGFVVIPENGAGGRDPDPRAADPAQFLIEVDTQPPRVTEVAASTRSGPNGVPQVEVTWKADDMNLDSYPIRIEYSETGDPNGVWTAINADRGPLANTGRHTWTVGDDVKPWKFYLRVSATDLAKLTGSQVTKDPVKVDLDTPKATIETIAAAKGGRAATPASANPVRTTAVTEPARLQNVVPSATPPFQTPAAESGPAPSGVMPPVVPSPPTGTPNPSGGPAMPAMPDLPNPPDTRPPG